jgi:hypothetical protein
MKPQYFLIAIFPVAMCCSSVQRYPDAKTKISLKGKGVLVAAQDRVSALPQVEAAYRKAAGEGAGSIHVLPIMPAPALELPVTAARTGLDKNGTKGLDPIAQLAVTETIRAGGRFGVKFDYIIFITAEKAGVSGPVTNVDHYAALYEIATKRVIGAAKEVGTTTGETAIEQLPRGARAVARLLLEGEE